MCTGWASHASSVHLKTFHCHLIHTIHSSLTNSICLPLTQRRQSQFFWTFIGLNQPSTDTSWFVFFWINSICLFIPHRCFCAVNRVELRSVKMLDMVKDRIMGVYDSLLAGTGKTSWTQVYYSPELNYAVRQAVAWHHFFLDGRCQ